MLQKPKKNISNTRCLAVARVGS